ncbi:MAG: hypothetical protein Q9222_000200 [Ikaeria aurantiellina]
MVELPSLEDICTKELRLDAARQKKLLKDAKNFRTNQLEITASLGNPLSTREIAKRYLDNGFAAKSIAPGRFHWPNTGSSTDNACYVLPGDYHIVLSGVERIFAKLDQNAAKNEKRKSFGSKSPQLGQENVDTEDVMRELQKGRAKDDIRRGTHISVEQPIDTTADQRQVQAFTPAHQAIDDEMAVQACGTKFMPEDPKDKTYAYPGRVSDQPTRVPETRNERKRRHNQPLDRRIREATLLPIEEANKRFGIGKLSRRRKAPKSSSVAMATNARKVSAQVLSGLQQPSPEIESSSAGFQDLSSSSVREPLHGDMPAPKRPRIDRFEMVRRVSGPDQEALLEENDGEVILEEANRGNSPIATHVPFQRLERHSFGSAESLDQSRMDVEPLGEGDDRSITLFVAPGSRRSTAEPEEAGTPPPSVSSGDDGTWNDVTSQQNQVPASSAITNIHEMDVVRQSVEDQAAQRPNLSLPPNIWVLTVEGSFSSWHQWTRIPLELLTIEDLARGVKKQTQKDHIDLMRIKLSDRKQEWIAKLRPDDELNFQDVKEMVCSKTTIRDIECSISDGGHH